MQCYDTTAESAQAAILLKTAPNDPGALAQRVAAARDFATRCAQRNGDLLDHLSTANVARDLDLAAAEPSRPARRLGLGCGLELRGVGEPEFAARRKAGRARLGLGEFKTLCGA